MSWKGSLSRKEGALLFEQADSLSKKTDFAFYSRYAPG
jgi:hypothetical protein